MSACVVDSGIKLRGLLILVASLFVFCGTSTATIGDKNAKPAKPELEIKKIKSCGLGPEKIRIPGVSRTVYVVGSSEEQIFTVKIKNNTKEEKRDVRLKLSVYDKEGKLIDEKSPRFLNALYVDEGYSIKEGILYPRKSVELYFAVSKKVKYLKAELLCKDKIIDTEVRPSSFKPSQKK